MCVFIVIEVGSVKSFINVSFLFADTWTIKVFSEYTEKLAEIARKKHEIITIHASLELITCQMIICLFFSVASPFPEDENYIFLCFFIASRSNYVRSCRCKAPWLFNLLLIAVNKRASLYASKFFLIAYARQQQSQRSRSSCVTSTQTALEGSLEFILNCMMILMAHVWCAKIE